MNNKLSPDDRDYVNSLANGLTVLKTFNHDKYALSLTEVAEKTGMDRAKSRRLLMTLEALGYVKKTGRTFELTPKVLELGYRYHAGGKMHSIIQQQLQHITDQLNESSSLGELDGDDVVYVLRSSATHRLMSINLNVGTRLPAAYTSMGRVLLSQFGDAELDAWIDEQSLVDHTPFSITEKQKLKNAIAISRSTGYSIVDQELDMGLRSIAVALKARDGRVIGAINISTNASRVKKAVLIEKYLPLLQEASTNIEKYLG